MYDRKWLPYLKKLPYLKNPPKQIPLSLGYVGANVISLLTDADDDDDGGSDHGHN